MNRDQLLERVYSLANEAIFAISLQCRRIRTKEPEDKVFVMRWWTDLQFLIVVLKRFRTILEITRNISEVSSEMNKALNEYDKIVPNIKKLRDVGEHIDDYAINSPNRHLKDIGNKQLQVGSWDGIVYEWLGIRLNIDEVTIAAEILFGTLQKLRKSKYV